MASFTILEPMSTGDVIDRAVRLYRRNFTPLVAITAVPTLIGYVVTLMFWYGYTGLLTGASSSGGMPITAIWMMALGGLGYPIWMFVLLVTVCGLSRVVGDHLMLGTPITFRGCFAAVRRRLGAITLMGLLMVALLFAAYIVVGILVFVLFLIGALMVGAIASAQLPQWLATVILTVSVIIAVALVLILILVVTSRVVFLPQIVMIEGESAGNALGRAMRLGKGNWYRVAAIVLFSYFVSLSLLAALTLPVFFVMYVLGLLTPEFFVSPTWNILYTSFRDVTGLLSLPIWIVSFTLLYFDSRVRKEAYDVDLLAREINPGFYWQPAVLNAPPGYRMPVQAVPGQAFVNTSPRGTAPPLGALPEGPRAIASEPLQTESEELRVRFERAAEGMRGGSEFSEAQCTACGATLLAGAQFCMKCGAAT